MKRLLFLMLLSTGNAIIQSAASAPPTSILPKPDRQKSTKKKTVSFAPETTGGVSGYYEPGSSKPGTQLNVDIPAQQEHLQRVLDARLLRSQISNQQQLGHLVNIERDDTGKVLAYTWKDPFGKKYELARDAFDANGIMNDYNAQHILQAIQKQQQKQFDELKVFYKQRYPDLGDLIDIDRDDKGMLQKLFFNNSVNGINTVLAKEAFNLDSTIKDKVYAQIDADIKKKEAERQKKRALEELQQKEFKSYKDFYGQHYSHLGEFVGFEKDPHGKIIAVNWNDTFGDRLKIPWHPVNFEGNGHMTSRLQDKLAKPTPKNNR